MYKRLQYRMVLASSAVLLICAPSPFFAEAIKEKALSHVAQVAQNPIGGGNIAVAAGQIGLQADAQGSSPPRAPAIIAGTRGTVTIDPSNPGAPLTFQESGARSNNALVQHPAILLDLSNIANKEQFKHGLNCVLLVANETANENADCIALTTYHEFNTPQQGASEASALYAAETGGGNTLSIYNLAKDAPPGLPRDYNNGRAIEVGVDGNKVGMSIEQYGAGGNGGGKALWILTADNTSGIVYQPYDDKAPQTRVLAVINKENTAEKAYITKDGSAYFANSLHVGGAVSPPRTTIAELPACNAKLGGALEVVTDALTPTFNRALAGGGSEMALALCNGRQWTAH